jgi:hypothetical protein
MTKPLEKFKQFKIRNVEDLENDSKFFAVIKLSRKRLKEYYTLLNKSPVYLDALVLYSQYKVHWIKKRN